MTIMYKDRKYAKVLENTNRVVVMYEFKTRYFKTWSAAIRFLMSNGYHF